MKRQGLTNSEREQQTDLKAALFEPAGPFRPGEHWYVEKRVWIGGEAFYVLEQSQPREGFASIQAAMDWLYAMGLIWDVDGDPTLHGWGDPWFVRMSGAPQAVAV